MDRLSPLWVEISKRDGDFIARELIAVYTLTH